MVAIGWQDPPLGGTVVFVWGISNVNHTPPEVFAFCFAEMERLEIPYVILHSYQDLPDFIPSDVDCAVPEKHLSRMKRLMHEVAEHTGWRLTQTLRYDIAAFYSVLVDPQNPRQFIKLDCSTHYTRNGCQFIPFSDLLAGRRRYRNFWVPGPGAEFLYVLTKALAKRKRIADFIPQLHELWQTDPARSQQLFTAVFGAAAGSLTEWFARPTTDWERLSEPMHARNRYRLPQRMAEYRRRLHRLRNPTGLLLIVLGTDGTGKSSVIAHLQELIAPSFRRQKVFHFCPMLLRKKHSEVVTEPHKRPPHNTFTSWLKVLYHFADHWFGFLLQQWPAKAQSACIIFDRHFDDLLIDPRRYRVCHSAGLVRFLRRLLPLRDRAYVLDAPAEVIRQRKAELPIEELERQRAALRQLAASDPQFVLVDATLSVESVAHTIARDIIEYLSARQSSRVGGQGTDCCKPDRRVV